MVPSCLNGNRSRSLVHVAQEFGTREGQTRPSVPLVVHEVGLSRLIIDVSLGSGGDPLASGAGRSRNSYQEQLFVAGGGDAVDLTGKLGVAVYVQRNRSRIQNDRRRAGITDQRPFYRCDRSRRAARIAAV